MTPTLPEHALVVGLHRLFQLNKWFDVCLVRNLATIAGVRISNYDDAIFSAVHCLEWTAMPPGMREQLATRFVQILQEKVPELTFNLDQRDTPRPNFVQRLLGRGS